MKAAVLLRLCPHILPSRQVLSLVKELKMKMGIPVVDPAAAGGDVRFLHMGANDGQGQMKLHK